MGVPLSTGKSYAQVDEAVLRAGRRRLSRRAAVTRVLRTGAIIGVVVATVLGLLVGMVSRIVDRLFAGALPSPSPLPFAAGGFVLCMGGAVVVVATVLRPHGDSSQWSSGRPAAQVFRAPSSADEDGWR